MASHISDCSWDPGTLGPWDPGTLGPSQALMDYTSETPGFLAPA